MPRLLVIAMIETPTAIANAEAIAAVPGIDALLIGTNDLAAEMGIPGEFGHARIVGAYETVIAACRKHNKWPGMGGVDAEELMQKYIGMGMRLVLTGSDGGFLMAGRRGVPSWSRMGRRLHCSSPPRASGHPRCAPCPLSRERRVVQEALHDHRLPRPLHHLAAPARGVADEQIEAHKAGKAPPPRPAITDDEIRETITGGQLKLQRERGTDLTIFSPRAAGMGHHLGDASTSEAWAAACNELIHRVCTLFPKNFIGVAMLPQSARVWPKNCLAEIDRCVNEYGFVGVNLNPDPSGGHWQDPPLGDRYWYPVYEKMVEYDIPAMVHVSAACNPAFTPPARTISAATPPGSTS